MPSKSNRNGRKNKATSNSNPISRTPSQPQSIEPSPMPSSTNSPAQRQLPTPLPELELQIGREREQVVVDEEREDRDDDRSYSRRHGDLGFTNDHDRSRSASPPTIAVDYDDFGGPSPSPPSALPVPGASPNALIDFGPASNAEDLRGTPHVDQYHPSDEYQSYNPTSSTYQHPHDYLVDLQDQQHDNEALYRSPPFKQAVLDEDTIPETSISPLPIRPRLLDDDQHETGSFSFEGGGSVGHTRSPIIPTRSVSHRSTRSSRSPSSQASRSPVSVSAAASNTLETLSRTIRSYAPAISSPRSLKIQSAAPYPPQVSRPVSFGMFSGGGGAGSQQQAQQQSYNERRRSFVEYDYGQGRGEEVEYESGEDGYQGHAHPYSTAGIQTSTTTVRKPVPERQGAWKGTRPVSGEYDFDPRTVTRRGRGRGVGVVEGASRGGVGGRPQGEGELEDTTVSGLSQTITARERGRVRYPAAKDEVDRVCWAKWERVGGVAGRKRLLLILGYSSGIQIWDMSKLASVKEILNINFDGDSLLGQLGVSRDVDVRVIDAAIVPGPPKRAKDELEAQRPVLGLLLHSARVDGSFATIFALYSLKAHEVVNKVEVAGVGEKFECNDKFIALSTSSPSTIHVLSATNLAILHSIPSTSLASFSHPSATPRSNDLLLPSDASTQPNPSPVFSLSGRLLAFAAPSPNVSSVGSMVGGQGQRRGSSSSSNGSGPSPSSFSSASPFSFGLSNISELSKGLTNISNKLPTTQAELGNTALKVGGELGSTALKVGGSVWGGVRFLGGKAVEAAKNRMVGNTDQAVGSGVGPDGRVSKSAPTDAGPEGLLLRNEEKARRRLSSNLALSPIDSGEDVGRQKTSVSPHTKPRIEKGHLVRVVDLFSLLQASTSNLHLPVVVEFVASRSQPVASLKFSADGCTILVVPRDGQVTKVFRISPGAPSRHHPEPLTHSISEELQVQPSGTAVHLYDLRRGVSSAVIEGLEMLNDGLLVGVSTKRRTVHVFPVNPYGGKPDVGSHIEGKVRNSVISVNQSKVHLLPIVRIRGSKVPSAETDTGQREHAPLAFTFVQLGDGVVIPNSLTVHSHSSVGGIPPSSPDLTLSSSPSRSPHSPHAVHTRPRSHHQDALLFDSIEGTLYLQRITFESRARPRESSASLSSVSTSLTSGFVSISQSLPGMGGAGPLSRSVSSSVSDRSGPGGVLIGSHVPQVGRHQTGRSLGGLEETSMELVGSVSVVATWNLVRGREWDEIRVPVVLEEVREGKVTGRKEEWLAQAELSTFSNSPHVLPRSIYLSHQFSFYDLGEDYHALIRRYHLNIAGVKIDVRKDIPIQAFSTSISTNSDEQFLDGFGSPTSPRGIRHVPSSFDEPLASALAGEMVTSSVSESILPMYPNGVPGSRTKSLLPSSIPIKGLGDGVSEGLGRLRRNIQKHGARIQGQRRADQPLNEHDSEMTFDFEEEGDFMSPRIHIKGPSNQDPRSLNSSVSALDDDVVGQVDEELWGERGWDHQDRQAIEDQEQYQTISKTVVQGNVTVPPAVQVSSGMMTTMPLPSPPALLSLSMSQVQSSKSRARKKSSAKTTSKRK